MWSKEQGRNGVQILKMVVQGITTRPPISSVQKVQPCASWCKSWGLGFALCISHLDSASRRARGRRAPGPGGGGGRMAAARRWRRRGRARGLVALRLGGLRLAPRPRLLPGGAAGAAERRAAAAARAAPSSPRAGGGGGGVVERCRQRRGGGRRRRVWERRLHRRGQAGGGGGRAPLAPQQRGPREGAVSEETPKSPLALPAGGGGGTRWRRPGGREFSSWIPAGGGGETGPTEAAEATSGGGG